MDRFGWKAAGGPDIPPNTTRKIASAFYQLNLVHCYFKAHLERFRIVQMAPANVDSGIRNPALADSLYLLYKAQRRELRKELQGQFTLGLMLGTKKGIRFTIQFLKETDISTKDCRISNIELKNEEEEIVEVDKT